MTLEWSTLSSLAPSCVVVRGAALMIAIALLFNALISFAKLLEIPLHNTFISSSWAKCVVDVVSCLLCFMTHFELE